MIEFTVLKKSKRSDARIGVLKTPHGNIFTPALIPVATNAVVKTLTAREVEETKTQALIANTYHLHLRAGERVIAQAGGLHRFMSWPHPVMTDSGGFQVFSLGFGRDYGLGKIGGRAGKKKSGVIEDNAQPKFLSITDLGVRFRSTIEGRELFLGPKESIRIQEKLGADIIFAFDECTAPAASYAYTASSLERTNRWALACLEAKTSTQALFGIVQGGRFKKLRIQSAQYVGGLPFDGFGIGGEFGYNKSAMVGMIRLVVSHLPEKKPRHLLGIGHPDDILKIIKAGVDTFDCIAPTHYARHGMAFTSRGWLDLTKSKFLKDKRRLDGACACETCRGYSRSYLTHLLKSREITALRLLTFHNLYYFNMLIECAREDIKNGKI